MSKKITIVNNSIRVEDTVSGDIELSQPHESVSYAERDLQNGIIQFYDSDSSSRSGSGYKRISLAEAVDVNNASFTESSFRSFAQINLSK